MSIFLKVPSLDIIKLLLFVFSISVSIHGGSKIKAMGQMSVQHYTIINHSGTLSQTSADRYYNCNRCYTNHKFKCNISIDIELSFLWLSSSISFIKHQAVGFILDKLPASKHGWTRGKHLQHRKCSFSLTNSKEHVTKTNRPKTNRHGTTNLTQCPRLIGRLPLNLRRVGLANIEKKKSP